MANIKSGINIFDSTSITIGNGTAVDGYIYLDNGTANYPAILYNNAESKWQFTNDGTTKVDIPLGGLVEFGTENVAGGTGALDSGSVSQAQYNTAFGYNAGTGLTTGDKNVFIGAESAPVNNSSENIIIGYDSGRVLTGNANIMIGVSVAYQATSATNNVYIGKWAGGKVVTGDYNVAIGEQAFYNSNGGSSPNNVAIGRGCLSGNISTNGGNIAIGAYSASSLFSPEYSISIGYDAQAKHNRSICIGYDTDARGDRSIVIGSQSHIQDGSSGDPAVIDVIILGSNNFTTGVNDINIKCITVGTNNSIYANNPYTKIFGYNNTATASSFDSPGKSVIIGDGCTIGANHNNAIVIGDSLTTKGDYTGIFGYPSTYIGRGQTEDIKIYAYNSAANTPYLKYNNSAAKWVGSNDGVAEFDFETATPTHNSLTGLQGGEADGYYHLTSDQHTWLTDGYTDGYWGISKGGTGITSYSQGDILYANASGNLTVLDIGTDNQVLTISSTLPTWADLPASVTVHNDLTGIQGGESDGYYHLTPGEHQFVVDGYDSGNFTDGYQLTINSNAGGIVWEPGYYHAIFVGKTGSLDGYTDGYLHPGMTTIDPTEDFAAFVPAIQSGISKMRVSMSQAPGGGESITVTLRKDGSDTSISVTVSDTSTSGSSDNTVLGFLTGSKASVRFVASAGAVVENLTVTMMVYPDNSVF